MKLDPSAYDRWWRSRIEKEEKDLEKDSPREGPSRKESAVLNTLGKAQLIASATESHLQGAGAVVRRNASHGPSAAEEPQQKQQQYLTNDDARSVASGARSVGARGAGGSVASQPRGFKTPAYSQAGTTHSRWRVGWRHSRRRWRRAGSPHAGGGGDAAAHGAGAAAGQVRAEAVGHTMCFVGPPAACRYTTWRSSSSSGPRKS